MGTAAIDFVSTKIPSYKFRVIQQRVSIVPELLLLAHWRVQRRSQTVRAIIDRSWIATPRSRALFRALRTSKADRLGAMDFCTVRLSDLCSMAFQSARVFFGWRGSPPTAGTHLLGSSKCMEGRVVLQY